MTLTLGEAAPPATLGGAVTGLDHSSIYAVRMQRRISGISVVIPTYSGGSRIATMLEALAGQTLAPELFETIVVENGTDDGTRWLVESMSRTHPDHRFRYVWRAEASSAAASNHGLELAEFSHLTLVDDDDKVSPRYLQALWEQREDGAMTVGFVADLPEDEPQIPTFDTYIVRALLPRAGRRVAVDEAATALAFNVAKLVPTELAQRHRFDPDLRSGGDVAYWAELAFGEGLDVVVARPHTGAVYYRVLREGSHSRPKERDFSWGIDAKLAVIERLAGRARLDTTVAGSRAARQLIRAQTAHMRRFLQGQPELHRQAVEAIEAAGLADVVDWAEFNAGRAERLVVSYCFPPTADTSAVVAARRVAEHGASVDVVSHAMTRVRPKDESLRRLTRPYVDKHIVVGGQEGALSWHGGVRQFVERGWKRVLERNGGTWPYRSVYSRAMWPASHLLAAHAVLQRPGTFWTAEMSDPLSVSTVGEEKVGDWDPQDPLAVQFVGAVTERGFEGPDGDRLAPWIESVTYALADEIVFTNPIQRDFMIGRIADERLRERVRGVSKVSPHPEPSARLYEEQPPLALPDDVINIGYFGNFYANRGLADVLRSLATFEQRERVMVHVFTDRPGSIADEIQTLGLQERVEVHGQLPYVQYLAQSRAFDVLLVNDTAATEYLGLNPYLPSKVSDYLGSGSDIWAVVEDGSPLSEVKVAFSSPIGDIEAAQDVLRSLVARHG